MPRDEPKLNREQRRRLRFGGRRMSGGAVPAGGVDPAMEGQALGDEATTGRPDQDQTHETGPGTGGATEQAGRVRRHAGTHATNSAKG